MPILNLSNNAKYAIFAASQFFLGFLTYVIEIVSYVLALEITSRKNATIVSIIFLNMYVVGELYVLIISYFFRDWHILYWCVAAYSILVTCFIAFLIPESPKILAANKKYGEAVALLNKFAKYNGTKLEKEITEGELLNALNESKKKENATEGTITIKTSAWYFLTHPWINLVRFCLMCYVWIAVSMVYFGVSLGITSISSNLNPYIMFLLSSLAEVVGYTGGVIGAKYSRNLILRICLFIAAVCCIIVAFIPVTSNSLTSWNSILIMLCVFGGKAMTSTAFNLIYIYTNQLYPTHVRNTLVSYTASAGRFGAIISPQINLLGNAVWGPLPYLIFSASTFVACVFLFFIPNEKNSEDDV